MVLFILDQLENYKKKWCKTNFESEKNLGLKYIFGFKKRFWDRRKFWIQKKNLGSIKKYFWVEKNVGS